MDHRHFLLTSLAGALATPLAAGAPQAVKVPRLGVLVVSEPVSPTDRNVTAFRQGLRDLGYIDGRNIVVEYRYAAELNALVIE